MSILADEIPGARVADFCAGSGALGLEALSRGAVHCEFIELNQKSLAALRRNIDDLGALDLCTVRRADAVRIARDAAPRAWDIVFADPPYDLGLSQQIAEQWLAIPFARILGVEHRWGETLPDGGETRRYGDTAITFYRDVTSSP